MLRNDASDNSYQSNLRLPSSVVSKIPYLFFSARIRILENIRSFSMTALSIAVTSTYLKFSLSKVT